MSQDILIREGASCTIPDGYNSSPFSDDFNIRGMDEFCTFPAQPFLEAIVQQYEDCKPLVEIPECGGLVLSPHIQTFPCYEIREK